MSEVFKIGTRVKLISFHGETKPAGPVEQGEDVWTLIGQDGEVVSDEVKQHPHYPDKGERALVRFDQSLTDQGLVNHNQVANSLWIFASDLEVIS